MVRSVPELAVLPRGTGTDFVRSFRIPTKLDGALGVVRSGATREIDAGKVLYRAWDGHDAVGYFANVASAGMSGAVAQRANTTSKAIGGSVSFFWATLPSSSAGRTPSRRWSRRRAPQAMYDVLVANCAYLGGGMR